MWGLNDAEVLAKHTRLTDPELFTATSIAINSRPESSPDALYRAVVKLMAAVPSH